MSEDRLGDDEVALGVGPEVAGGLLELVAEDGEPALFLDAVEEGALGFEGADDVEVVGHDEGQAEVHGGRDHVAEEHDVVPVAVFEHHRLVPRGVPGRGEHADAGRDLDLTVHAIEQARFCDGTEIFGEVAGAIALVRVRRVVPLARLDHVACAGKHRRKARGCASRGATRVIEVQVGHDHVVDRVGRDAERAQVAFDGLVVIDAVDVFLFGRELVAVAGFNEHAAAAAFDQQAVRRVAAAVLVVARDQPRPDALGDDAVHGAAVEPEVAAVDQADLEITEAHEAQRSRVVASINARNLGGNLGQMSEQLDRARHDRVRTQRRRRRTAPVSPQATAHAAKAGGVRGFDVARGVADHRARAWQLDPELVGR